MPRLVQLISERKIKSRTSSAPSPGHTWRRIKENGGRDQNSRGTSSVGSHAAEGTTEFKRSYKHLEERRGQTSDSDMRIPSTEDIELAMWEQFDVRSFADLLERRLDTGFTLPQLSYR